MKPDPNYLFLYVLVLVLAACGGNDSNHSEKSNNTNSPVFTSPLTVTIIENATIAYTAEATDADGDILNFILTGGADQALFTLDGITGLLSFNTAPDFDVPADSDGNNSYIVEISVTDGLHQVSQSITIYVEPEPPISVSFYTPYANQTVGTDLSIIVTINSDYEISSVTASVENISTNLTFSSSAYCTSSWNCFSGFTGTLSLMGLAPGPHNLTVTAKDFYDNTVSKQCPIIFDNKPTLTVTAPAQFSVARPELQLDISCSDDRGDCDISVHVNDSSHDAIASGTNVLSDTLDLSAYDGSEINLIIKATDSSTLVTSESRTVYVETSSNLVLSKEFTNQIIDFDGTRALIQTSGDNGDSLTIQYTTPDTITNVEVPSNISICKGFLTPTGVVYTSCDDVIYDWNNSNLRNLGPAYSESLIVSGDYGIWCEGTLTLWLRQFSTETITQVSTSASIPIPNSIASNGVVVYSNILGDIIQYDAGVSTQLTSSSYPLDRHVYPVTDGHGVVYELIDQSFEQIVGIAFNDGISELVLTNIRNLQQSPGTDYQINNGWIAYTDQGNMKQTHVWTRDPSGTLLQRTFFASDTYIDKLSSAGEVMVINNDKRYLSRPTGELNYVNLDFGSAVNFNGTWFVIIGCSLFEVSL